MYAISPVGLWHLVAKTELKLKLLALSPSGGQKYDCSISAA